MTVTFEGIKYAFRQTKDGHVLSFVVHPNDLTDSVILAPIGSRVKVTLTEIGEQPKTSPTVKPGRSETAALAGEGKKWNEMSRAQQAGILCGDQHFSIFLGTTSPEETKQAIYERCGIQTRKALDVVESAGKQWDALVMEYRMANGQFAEQRGG